VKDLCLTHLMVGIKGAGEMASGLAWRLHQANIHRIFMMETEAPQAVRRGVCFCDAVHSLTKNVEGVEAVRAVDENGIHLAWQRNQIAVLVDPAWTYIDKIKPDIVIDAILAKKNMGTTIDEAPLVIGLGPGFEAGRDAHIVIETNRGHNLGKVILSGTAEKNTGVPGDINGFTRERVLRSPADGVFFSEFQIGMSVKPGDVIGTVNNRRVSAEIPGVLRGLIRPGIIVKEGTKIGDIDPRGDINYCNTISDKARAIGGGVLEAVFRSVINQPPCFFQHG
jgi:xanthine dehydrogenase accessory factor